MKKEKEELFLSEYERKEILRGRIYRLLPVVAILLLIGLWMLASSGASSQFPSPAEVWARYMKMVERPIRKLGLLGHIWASLQRVFIALAFAWVIGISFGILIGWNKKPMRFLGRFLQLSGRFPLWHGCLL